jgi:hypothetical protein
VTIGIVGTVEFFVFVVVVREDDKTSHIQRNCHGGPGVRATAQGVTTASVGFACGCLRIGTLGAVKIPIVVVQEYSESLPARTAQVSRLGMPAP